MCSNAEISLKKKILCWWRQFLFFCCIQAEKILLILYISGASLHILQAPLLLFPPHSPNFHEYPLFLPSPDWPTHPNTDFHFSLLYCFPHLAPHRHLIPPSAAHFMYQPSFCPSSNLLYSSVLYHFFFFDINQGLPASSCPHILCTFLSVAAFLEALIKSINHWNHLIPSFLHCRSGTLFSPVWVK